MQFAGPLDIAAFGLFIQLDDHLWDDARGGDGAPADAHEHRGEHDLLATGHHHVVGALLAQAVHGVEQPRQVAAGVLGAADPIVGQKPLQQIYRQLLGKLRDIAQQDVQRRFPGDFGEVLEKALGGNLVVIGGHQRNGIHAERGVVFGHLEHVAQVGLASSGQYGYAPLVDLADQSHHILALLLRQARELTRAAVGVQPVDPSLDQPVDVALHLGVVDPVLAVEKDDIGAEDASKCLASGRARNRWCRCWCQC